MSKYKNKQGSQGYWERVEIVQQFGIESIKKKFFPCPMYVCPSDLGPGLD
jgi:hypothetical protein